MIADASLRWICSALFAFAAGYCVYRIARATTVNTRIDHGFHLAMCVAMIAMAWPWGLGVPLLPQGVFFGAATVWFARSAMRSRSVSDEPNGDEHAHGPVLGAYHAFMMAAMVWMVAVMAGWLPGSAAHDHASGASMDEMSGMDGMHAHAPRMDMSAMPAEPVWISAVSIAFTVSFVVAAIVALYQFFVAERAAATLPAQSTGNTALSVLAAPRLRAVGASCDVAMAAGMAIMMGVM